MKGFLSILTALGLVSCANSPKIPEDQYLWLEAVEDPKALEWVKKQNEASLKVLETDPRFKPMEKEIAKILNAKDRIPRVELMNGQVYNFWQDDKNVRGVWRRTSLAEFKNKQPKWEILLDIDQLATKEKENWVWKYHSCLPPQYDRCLVMLSRGGKDAVVVREFDTKKKTFVADGFNVPESKIRIAWRDQDSLLLGTDFGPDSLTTAGYPREVRIWRRGSNFKEAKPLFKCEKTDVSCAGFTTWSRDGGKFWIVRSETFFESEVWSLSADDKLTRVRIPDDAEFQTVFKDHLIFILRTKWKSGEAGDLMSLSPSGDVQVVARAGTNGTILSASVSQDAIYVVRMENVANQIERITLEQDLWKAQKIVLPVLGSADLAGISAFDQTVLFDYEDYLTPPSLFVADDGIAPVKIKSKSERFNSKGLTVRQYFATSRDGVQVPYFLITNPSRKGPQPTLLYGYGGFEVPLTPGYYDVVGKVWLEKGGTYAVANIRGGNEFGPKWHQAALKDKRQTAYDDFIAVSEDLIRRGFTTSQKLGIRGGSNGGLLTGVVSVQRPDLYKAVLSQVPLLDMLRYHQLLAGASWMSEYGDPEKSSIREFWARTSPYQNVKSGVKYPRIFFSTSTKDDRVHPGHARKMVARMSEQGHSVLYFENMEGGHSAASNLLQRARREAQAYVYLYQELM